MMKFIKAIIGPFIVGVLACLMQIIDQYLAAGTIVHNLLPAGGGWIAFQAWAVYFYSGSIFEGGVKAFISYILGIAVAVIAFELGAGIGGFLGIPIALLIIVTIANCNGYFKWIGNVPALFVGAGAYFCIMSYIAPAAAAPYTGSYVPFALVELFYCVFGLVFGWITIVLQNACTKALSKKDTAAV
jgi:hypothetical protein